MHRSGATIGSYPIKFFDPPLTCSYLADTACVEIDDPQLFEILFTVCDFPPYSLNRPSSKRLL